MAKRVPVGVGVLVMRRAPGALEVLVGLRKGSHGADLWALPGGWLEYGESFEVCGMRELEEEAGITSEDVEGCNQLETAPACPNLFLDSEGRVEMHTVTVFVGCTVKDSSRHAHPAPPPEPLELEKCHGFRWVLWDAIPRPLFPALEQLVSSWRPVGA